MRKDIFTKFMFIFAVAALIFSGAFAEDVVVDNDDGAPGFTSVGTWSLSSATGYNGGTYRYAYANSGATAMWTPNLIFPGRYNVYAIFVKGGNRTTSAPYKIIHAGGETTVNIDQKGTTDEYYKVSEVYIGSFIFSSGTINSVTLMTNGASGVYISDAIRFQPQEDAPAQISDINHLPYYPAPMENITVQARIVDDVFVKSATLFWQAEPSGTSGNSTMFDDGLHNDIAANDFIYAASIPGAPFGEKIEFTLEVTDSADHLTSSPINIIDVGKTPDINLVVNELLASNLRGETDPDFQDASDWIEIANLGPDVADLGSFAISDSASTSSLWKFPDNTFLAPGQYLLIWADGMNTVANAMHTNFKLSADGEKVVLFDLRNNRVADRVDFGAQITDISYARIPDKTGDWIGTEKPTPGAANIYIKSGKAPVFSKPSGVYKTVFTVEIKTSETSTIHYTLDGSDPDVTSPEYSKPLTMASTCSLRARAYYDNLDPSPITSVTYFFNPPADLKIPIMNLIIDPDDFDGPNGIYTNSDERGLDWEKPVHASVMSPDGTQVFDIDAGARLHGGYSRELAKKSLRLYFRSNYGTTKWSLPWMKKIPVDGFQQLVLRSGANDGFLGGSTIRPTYYRDQLMRDWYSDMGQRSPDGFFVSLYINGAYWGLYNATERVTDIFMEDTYGGEEWDIIKGSWDFTQKYFTEAVDGDLAGWNQFIEWLENHDVSTDADFQMLASMVDIQNFMEHFALNIICQNHDWPHNNWIATHPHDQAKGLWTFHEWDAEWSIGLNPSGWQSDTLTWARGNNYYLQRQYAMPPLCLLFSGNDVDPNTTKVINGLLDRPEGKQAFISSVEETLNFELRPENAIANSSFYANLLSSEVAREAARWASSAGISAQTLIANWNTGVSNIQAFLTNRPAFIRNLISNFFSLGGTKSVSFSATGSGKGRLRINNRTVSLPWSGVFFLGSNISLRPLPDTDSKFDSWSGIVQSANPILDYTVAGTTDGEIILKFEKAENPIKPNDVIFNEYWLNDNESIYPSLANRAIDGDWIELLVVRDGVDLRGWRITNNKTISEGGADLTGGSIIFPNADFLQSLPSGTIVLLITKTSDANADSFPSDEIDWAKKRIIFYVGNGNLDLATDPGFSVPTGNTALVLLAPNMTADFSDDIGVDFIAEGTDVTPESFGVASQGVIFTNPFSGIGGDDGAVFINSPAGGFINDNGEDANRDDFLAGSGGWIVDPPKTYTGDDTAAGSVNWLTPGAQNHGQSPLPPVHNLGWFLF